KEQRTVALRGDLLARSEEVAELLHAGDEALRSEFPLLPGEAHLPQAGVHLDGDAALLAPEEFVHQPDAGGAADALDVEVQAAQLPARRLGALEERLEPREAARPALLHDGGALVSRELVVAIEPFFVEEPVDGLTPPAAEVAPRERGGDRGMAV